MSSKNLFAMASQGTKTITIALKQLNNKTAIAPITNWVSARPYSVNQLTNNLQLLTQDKNSRVEKGASGPKVIQAEKKPLVIILAWMLAKEKHLAKYSNFYMEQGFDVLNVHLSPWQLLWPVKGSQVVAGEVVNFLHVNHSFHPLLIHGFSVGGYLWGEVLVKLHSQPELYKPIVDRFIGQVWDSAADITEIPIGFPRAVFPRNKILQVATEKYISYHMRTFHDVATCHYIRSSQMFHTNLVKAPALFLLSKTDPVGSEESNKRVHDTWVAGGIQASWKCWDKSPHVGHYRKYPKEYTSELYKFLNSLSLMPSPEKIRAKL